MATAAKLVKLGIVEQASRMVNVLPLLSAEDVARITGLSVETLAQWRSQRRGIPFVKMSRNCVRYRQQDLDAWLEARIVRVEQDLSNAERRL